MTDVSRETPSWPVEAERVFPLPRLPSAASYAALLADDGVTRGLIGPREVPRLWDRHLINCALMAEAIPQDATVCDIGSGAGLPGIVLAIARPDLTITLVEPLLRRTTFLDEVVSALALNAVTVVRGRAEEVRGTTYDVVTSRAVAPLGRLLTWSMPLVSPAGAVVAMKGSSIVEEIEESRPVWTRLGCAVPEVVTVGGDTGLSTATLVRVAWSDRRRVSSDLANGPRTPGGRRRSRRSDRRPHP